MAPATTSFAPKMLESNFNLILLATMAVVSHRIFHPHQRTFMFVQLTTS